MSRHHLSLGSLVLLLAGLLAGSPSALPAAVSQTKGEPYEASGPAQAVPNSPNVVVVLVDDARYDDLATLPVIKSRIGATGATLTDFYAPFPLCCPSRATLLTGQYAHNHGVLANEAPLGGFSGFDDSSTLATWLTPTYTTGLIGKYLNQYQVPYKPPGWDEWMVPRGTYDYLNEAWSINTGSGPSNKRYPGYQTDTMGQLAESFIRRHASDRDPFFLYTSIVAPHAGNPADPQDPAGFPTPFVKPEYRNVFEGRAITDRSFNEADVGDKPVRPSPLRPAEIAGLTEANAQRREALLSAQDATVQILDTLRDTGELDNTFVFFMSDNGYILGEHRIRGGKVAPYEVSNRVPMLVRGPGIAPGTVVDQVTSQVDFAPTVLAMTGNLGANDTPIDGINLIPFLQDPNSARTSREAVVLEAGPESSTTTRYRYQGVRSGQWKYVERQGGQEELYDLRGDPYELENVAARPGFGQTPVQRQAQTRLDVLLDRYRWCAGAKCR